MAEINKLELSLVVQDSILPNVVKKISHWRFTMDENLEMIQYVNVVYHENINGFAGEPMLQIIEADETLTEERKRVYREMFQTKTYETSTRGYIVNPLNGEAAVPIDGQLPADSISEVEYWQRLPKETFTQTALEQIAPGIQFYPGTTLAELIYNGLLLSALKMVQRNRI